MSTSTEKKQHYCKFCGDEVSYIKIADKFKTCNGRDELRYVKDEQGNWTAKYYKVPHWCGNRPKTVGVTINNDHQDIFDAPPF